MQPHQIILVVTYFVFIFIGSYFFHKGKIKLSLILVSLATFVMLIFFIFSLPFINPWDERYHAVVAKNIAKHFPIPTLYEPPYLKHAFYYGFWDQTKVWLHKQPLFLWQMAIFIKLLGKYVYTIRIPDLIMGTLLIYPIYRIGKIVFSERAGFLAAVLFSSTIFLYELANGRRTTDHNDFMFISYVSLSIWALVEYLYSNNKKWLILIGLFSGFAILCKWLVGLLIYSGWGILKLSQKKFKLKYYQDIIKSLIITTIIFLPWQIFTYLKYPVEFMVEQEYNALHIIEPVEGKEGDWTFHFLAFNQIYGRYTWIFFIPAFILFVTKTKKKFAIPLVGMTIVLYTFFTLVATKMPAFTAPAYFVILTILAVFWALLLEKLHIKRFHPIMFALMVTIVAFIKIEVSYLTKKYGNLEKSNDPHIVRQYKYYKYLQTLSFPKNSIVFAKLPGQLHTNIMFYHDINAYGFIPSYRDCLEIKDYGMQIIIVAGKDVYVPEYTKYLDWVKVIRAPLEWNYGIEEE